VSAITDDGKYVPLTTYVNGLNHVASTQYYTETLGTGISDEVT